MNEGIPAERRFDSEAEYRAAILDTLAIASSRIRILDFDLSRMHLDRMPAITGLTNFLNRGADREILISLHSTSFLATRANRLTDLLARHAGLVQLRQIPDKLRHLSDSHLIADSRHGVRRFHFDHARGNVIRHDPDQVGAWDRRFDELWSMCEPITTIKPLGL
jgi:hypothetical protein